jgi:hypothetical protein
MNSFVCSWSKHTFNFMANYAVHNCKGFYPRFTFRLTTCDTIQKSERRHAILRSKSDISHRYSVAPRPSLPPQPRSGAQLDKFFEQLGLDTGDFRFVKHTVAFIIIIIIILAL